VVEDSGVTPLAGTRVVDVTVSLAGPYCTQLLGALGAEVIKVERPGAGDETRAWGVGGESPLFIAANANKRSLALDLSRDEARDVLLRLADGADVFVQSLRPGLAERRGLGPDELRRRNPRLVYCSIGAFGRRGPLREEPGYDPLMQAAAGIMSVTGEPDGPPVRVGVSLVDQTTALWAALGILVALSERERNGAGRTVDVSLFESAVSLVPYHVLDYLRTGTVAGRHGTAFPLIAPYEAFETADGSLMLAAGNDRLFARLCDALELSALPKDPRFATNPLRVEHREALRALLAERLRTGTNAVWLERLSAARVPASPINDVRGVAKHEQTQALGLLQALGGEQLVAPPLSLDGERVQHVSPPPAVGADTEAVLGELGYAEEEIARLVGNGPAR
jgi:crotonobetainyl-CoA:carnitine CoA-transferase CaiB-like acyl-CoA transferase